MNEPLSPTTFGWIITALVGVVAGLWAIYDAFNLYKVRAADGSDPLIRDRRFGYIIGILIGLVGVAGTIKFHL